MKPVLALIRKEFLIDWRDKQAWSSVLLYIIATVYVVFLAFQKIIEAETWNALLWVILLFTAFNVVSRTYDQDKNGKDIYLYTLASARQVFLAKTIYSSIFMLFAGLVAASAFSFFLPTPSDFQSTGLFYSSALILGSIGLTSILSLISAIAWKTSANSGMIAILGFPVIIPLLLAVITYSEGIISGSTWSFLWIYALSLGLLAVLGIALGFVLFPYIWRD
ncbi:MAG: ABC transporter permease [Flavobacteriales bacterium]|nr:ABC transporter permease [Flavobacteriales bacterium]